MAKRQSLKDKLRSERASKNKTKLAPKINLQKKEKNVELIAKQADSIHVTGDVPTKAIKQKVETKSVKKIEQTKVSKPKRVSVDKERLTVWLPKPILKKVKVHAASKEIKLTDYFTSLIKKDLGLK